MCHEEVRDALAQSEELADFGIHSVLIGSYRRDVSIRRVKDVDVFCKLENLLDVEPDIGALALRSPDASIAWISERRRCRSVPLLHRIRCGAVGLVTDARRISQIGAGATDVAGGTSGGLPTLRSDRGRRVDVRFRPSRERHSRRDRPGVCVRATRHGATNWTRTHGSHVRQAGRPALFGGDRLGWLLPDPVWLAAVRSTWSWRQTASLMRRFNARSASFLFLSSAILRR